MEKEKTIEGSDRATERDIEKQKQPAQNWMAMKRKVEKNMKFDGFVFRFFFIYICSVITHSSNKLCSVAVVVVSDDPLWRVIRLFPPKKD